VRCFGTAPIEEAIDGNKKLRIEVVWSCEKTNSSAPVRKLRKVYQILSSLIM